MPELARSKDWKTENMPAEVSRLDFQRIDSQEKFERIELGLIPKEMEDKWFIYYENKTLHIHRSWTGYCIYQITIHGRSYLPGRASLSK